MNNNLEYGIREGRIVHISELKQTERGGKCNCTCPECGEFLVAKLGEKRKWHFAHNPSSTCDVNKARETGLHLLAKEIIQENHNILVPGLEIKKEEIVPNDAIAAVAAGVNIKLPNMSSCLVDYDSVEIEKPIKDIVADAVIVVQGITCIVEVAVTHFVDEDKRNKLKEIGLSAFEIDLSDLLKGTPTRDEIAKAVLSDESNRKWVFNRKKENQLPKIKAEYQKEYNSALLKWEQDKKQEQEIRQKKVRELRELMIPANYARELERLRNDEQAARWFKQFSFSRKISDYPFYMDIPISGEFVLTCDRRIWQGKLFNDYVYWGGMEYDFISIYQIQERIFHKKMIIQYDQMIVQYDPEKAFPVRGPERELSFAYSVVRRYFEYLELLGFVITHGEDLWWHGRSETIGAPNQRTAGILHDILKSVDRSSPNINQIIKNKLLSSNKLNKWERDDIHGWI